MNEYPITRENNLGVHALSRHYSELILRLQGEMRTELRQWAKQKKEQEELVENLRDKIASQTVSPAPRALHHSNVEVLLFAASRRYHFWLADQVNGPSLEV